MNQNILKLSPVILKNVWHKAICNERFKLDDEDNAAKIPVIVVPILLPRVSGKMRSIDTIPIPTRGTRVEVKTELL